MLNGLVKRLKKFIFDILTLSYPEYRIATFLVILFLLLIIPVSFLESLPDLSICHHALGKYCYSFGITRGVSSLIKGNLHQAIEYKVFGELMGLLTRNYPDESERRTKIFLFLKRNRILKIKRNDVDILKVQETFENLKKRFKDRDNDLKIISVYYTAGIDCISTNNIKDFKEPCDFLNISLDNKPIVEIGSMKDVNMMLKELYRNHPFRRNKKRKRY